MSTVLKMMLLIFCTAVLLFFFYQPKTYFSYSTSFNPTETSKSAVKEVVSEIQTTATIGLINPLRQEVKKIQLLFVGDMMFDRTIRKHIEINGFDYIFSCLKNTLNDFDFVIGNLEGPITSNISLSRNTVPGDANNTTFTFPVETAHFLYLNNIKVVSLANNHIFDFGKSGLVETREALTEAGVKWFGDPVDPEHKSLVLEKDDKKIVIIGFNQFLGVDSVQKTIEEIEYYMGQRDNLAQTIMIVFAHWGEEYIEPTNFMRNNARLFIDAGADLIIGAHPHIIQETEIYKEKEIHYSLGNFIFDQYWTEDVRRGRGVILTLDGKSFSTRKMDFVLNPDGTTCPIVNQ